MKKYLIIWLLLCNTTIAQTMNSEALKTIEFLAKLPEQDRPYVKVFTTYDIPQDLREDAILALSFVCASLTGYGSSDLDNTANYRPIAKIENGKFTPLQQVPGSDTLWYININDYNWTIDSFERVAALSPYEAEPVIEYKNSAALRQLSGNCLLRASWFIVHSTDVMRQADLGIQTKIYYELLYAKTGIPKTGDEFKKIWGLDEEKAKYYSGDSGAVSIDSKVVALHNRVLRQFPTMSGGYLYESIDVQNEEDLRDYFETLPENGGKNPPVKDAGEIIASNMLGVQTYALVNSEDKVIDFADPTIARSPDDFLSDARVRVGISCMSCHFSGLIPVRNVASEYKDYLNIKTPHYEERARIERIYQSGKFSEKAKEDSDKFAAALLKINGLTPAENIAALETTIKWYDSPLDIQQIYLELGTNEQTLREKIENSHEVFGVDKIPGRLKLALHENRPIPVKRNIWESNSKERPGLFQQTHVLLNGLTAVSKEYVENPLSKDDPRVEIEVHIDSTNTTKAPTAVKVFSGSKNIYTYQSGETIVLSGNTKLLNGIKWVEVLLDNGKLKAYINSRDLER